MATATAYRTLPAPFNRPGINSESSLKLVCLRWLQNQPDLWFFRVAAHHGYGSKGAATPSQMKGIPDFLILKDENFFAAELKVSGGKLSSDQENMILWMIECGATAGIVTSLDGLRDMLKQEKPLIEDWVVPIY